MSFRVKTNYFRVSRVKMFGEPIKEKFGLVINVLGIY